MKRLVYLTASSHTNREGLASACNPFAKQGMYLYFGKLTQTQLLLSYAGFRRLVFSGPRFLGPISKSVPRALVIITFPSKEGEVQVLSPALLKLNGSSDIRSDGLFYFIAKAAHRQHASNIIFPLIEKCN